MNAHRPPSPTPHTEHCGGADALMSPPTSTQDSNYRRQNNQPGVPTPFPTNIPACSSSCCCHCRCFETVCVLKRGVSGLLGTELVACGLLHSHHYYHLPSCLHSTKPLRAKPPCAIVPDQCITHGTVTLVHGGTSTCCTKPAPLLLVLKCMMTVVSARKAAKGRNEQELQGALITCHITWH
jgi:hypothetical protein